MAPKRFLCPYCAADCFVSAKSPEHVIPAALGAELTVPACFHCNQKAGREVDRPLLEDLWILEQRHRHGIADRRGVIPPAPVVEGRMRDGEKVLTRMEPGGWRPWMPPKTEQTGESTFSVRVDSAEPEETLATIMRRLGEKHGGEAQIRERELGPVGDGFVQIGYSTTIDMWPKFGARLALAFAAAAGEAEWLRGDDAGLLRATMWGAFESGLPPMPTVVGELGLFKDLVQPPEHAAWVMRTSAGAGLLVVLFGTFFYGAPLGSSWPVDVLPAWRFDPIERTHERMTADEWLTTLVLRVAHAEPEFE